MAATLKYFQNLRTNALLRVAEYLSSQGDFEVITEGGGYQKFLKEYDIWKGNIEVLGESWPIIFLFGNFFPFDPPTVLSPKAENLYLENPHILEEGYLCILPDSSSFDIHNIEDLLSHYLYSARRILSGTSDSDFREEFSSYWNRKLSSKEITCLLVSSPKTIKHTLSVFKSKDLVLAGDDKDSLNRWCSNYLEEDKNLESFYDGIFLNIDAPLIPSEYPDNCSDLLTLAFEKDQVAYELISNQLINKTGPIVILLKQEISNGYSMGCIAFNSPGLMRYTKLHRGFRQGHIPKERLLTRGISVLKETFVQRYKVIRTDYDWIHSRGGDGYNFADKAVAVIGCGSIGGYIAHTLAKSGIGKLLLIDKENMEWANIGRHILGAQYVGLPKSIAVKKYLSKEMPHININSEIGNWLNLFNNNQELFAGYDAIIVSIADWRYEKLLNKLVLEKVIPTGLFTWLEPYAVAGHCYISSGSGCLNCHMNELGQFHHAVSIFNDTTLKREPGGCTFYQPYGPTALLNTVSMTCRVLLKHLFKPIDSTLYTWISEEEHFNDSGAVISKEWVEIINDEGFSKVYKKVLQNGNCEICKEN